MASARHERSDRRSGLTPRAVVLAVVVVGVAVSIALPVRELVAQRTQIATLQSQNATETSRLSQLQAMERQWNDPYFVQQQARSRLFWVMPGEQPFTVIGHTGKPAPTPTPVSAWSPPPAVAPAWYTALWKSVKSAGAARPS
jgi:cell division protein FtsB